MKIIAIGRNYAEHARELNHPVSDFPVIFMKPDTALSKNDQDFYLPDFSKEIHHEIELVLKICKEGKHIAPELAESYFDEIGLGIDFTARDLQENLRKQGLPWELCKSFDHSAPVSDFVAKTSFKHLGSIHFSLKKNQEEVQKGNSADMLFSFSTIISTVSRFITLKKGDLIFTGTPKGVGKVSIGDRLEGFLEGKRMLDIQIK